MYSPKVKEELVKKLYRHKLNYPESKPLTFFVNEAIQEYLQKTGGPHVADNRTMVLGPRQTKKNNSKNPKNGGKR